MKLKSLLTALAPVAVLLSSCLKSTNTTDLLEDNGSIVTVITDVGATGGERVFSLEGFPVNEDLELMTVRVYSSGNAKPNGPVHVKLAITNAANYFPMPASGYSVPLEFDIPSGTSEYKVPITIKKNMLDLSKSNGFQISIASVSQGVIGKNDRTMVFGFLIKNLWDGIYLLKSYTSHPVNAALTGPCGPYEIGLVTTGSNKVIWDVTHPWANGSGSVTPAGYNPVFTISPTNVVTVSDISGIGFQNDPTYPNPRWDPPTKTFFVKWKYNAAGGDRMFTDTLTYLRPR